MANVLYKKAEDAFLNGGINLLTDDIRGILVTSSYTPDTTESGHQYLSDISGGYRVTSGVALTSKSISNGIFTAATLVFPTVTSGSTATYLILYKNTGTDSTSALITKIDSGTNLPVSTTGGDIDILWDGTNGIIKLNP
jgi:hypothetical protein